MMPFLKQWLRGLGMPSFNLNKWHGYDFRVLPKKDSIRDLVYWILLRNEIIPYFYGTDIIFDLGIIPPPKAKINETIEYTWELCTADDGKTIKEDEGAIIIKTLHRINRKVEAIKIGYLSKVQQYQLILYVTSSVYGKSPKMIAADFTLMDRDVFNVNLIWTLAGALIGLVIGYLIGN